MKYGKITVHKDGTATVTTPKGEERVETHYGNTRKKTLKDIQAMYPLEGPFAGHWGRGHYWINMD